MQTHTHTGIVGTAPSSPPGIAATLKGLLEDVDAVVRQRAAHALGIIAR